MLLEEVQDSQVTSLVQMMRSGGTIKLEDFPGGDTSFRRNLEKKNNGKLPKDEKCDPVPVHQGNLRPRKPVVVNIEELSSSGDSKPLGSPQSGRCTHEDLKSWLLVHFEKLSNQIDEIGRNICRSLGVPEETIHDSRKRKASDDHHRQSASPTGNQKSNTASEQRETGDENECDNTRMPRPIENIAAQETRTPNPAEDAQQQETPSTAVVVFTDVVCAQPQSCVLPPKNTTTRHFVDQVDSPVKWGESNPHLYRSVATVCSIHPSWKANPSSKAKVEETNLEFPAMEEEERYDSCREDMSTDTHMQQKRGNPVSETEEDSSFVPSGVSESVPVMLSPIASSRT
ncbi:hypothetical protein Bca4012_084457 [Brassica carinata]